MIIIKNDDELAKMRAAGSVAARVSNLVVQSLAPGITTGEISEIAADEIKRMGGESAFLGYRGFPGHICVSVNEEVIHGIPGLRRIAVGDVVSVDIGVRVDGFVADMARTVMIGVSDPEIIRLVKTAERALQSAISETRAGKHLSDLSHAIEEEVVSAGFSVVRQFVGHGVGRNIHEEPQIPNFGPAGRGPKLKPGMTLAVEPMVNMGCSDVETMDDGWTAVTKDCKPSAHFEHTIAVREGAAEVLTAFG